MQQKKALKVYSIVSLKLGWLLCVGGAALGLWWLGPLSVVVLVALHLKLSGQAQTELRLIMKLGLLGLALDSALSAAGLINYAGSSLVPLAPLWIVALWCLLASTLNSSFSWLEGRMLLGSALGILAGPMGYLAAERLGALSFETGPTKAVVAIALAWGFAIPAAVRLASASRQTAQLAPREVGFT